MARKKTYTKKTLAEAVDRYFKSITRIIKVTELVETGKRDDKGHKVFERVTIKNNLGEEAEVEEYIVPPTVGALCQHLGIHRSTWADYCNKPEFSDTTTYARGRMRAYLEQQLLTRKDVKGIIFDLQNNHGYAEKRQLEFGERASNALSTASMPMSEKKKLLAEVAREFATSGDTDEQAED